jgi:hypothetical protein
MQGVLKTRLNAEARRSITQQEYERPKSDRRRLRSVFFLFFLICSFVVECKIYQCCSPFIIYLFIYSFFLQTCFIINQSSSSILISIYLVGMRVLLEIPCVTQHTCKQTQ